MYQLGNSQPPESPITAARFAATGCPPHSSARLESPLMSARFTVPCAPNSHSRDSKSYQLCYVYMPVNQQFNRLEVSTWEPSPPPCPNTAEPKQCHGKLFLALPCSIPAPFLPPSHPFYHPDLDGFKPDFNSVPKLLHPLL